jgi:ABC-type transporter MlaC component
VPIGAPVHSGAAIEVPTVVTRETGDAPAHITWVVGTGTGHLRIIDIVVGGISLRLTQRGDYIAFLGKNDNNLEALFRALRDQIGTS